jgi:hypothetical protein
MALRWPLSLSSLEFSLGRRGRANTPEAAVTPWKTLAMNFSTAYDASTLEGLPGVNVGIHLDEDDAFEKVDARQGLTVETLQTDVEYQLKLVGIRVLTEDDCLLTPSCPVLLVTVGIVEAKGDLTGVHAFALTVGLHQMATLAGGARISAETWNMGYVGFAASSKVRTLVREQVKAKTIAFVNAWLTVNPRTNVLTWA